MKRLTTDSPTSNVEMLLNFAYSKDGRVTLRGLAGGDGDVDLCDYIEQQRRELGFDCGVCAADVMDGACMECDCVLAVLNVLAIQAAELRSRLAMYEDAGPVREKGEWVHCNGKSNLWYCSKCGEKIKYNPTRRTYNIEKKRVDEVNKLCRNCGADMRKG